MAQGRFDARETKINIKDSCDMFLPTTEVRTSVDDGDAIQIKGGRHPSLRRGAGAHCFVPNTHDTGLPTPASVGGLDHHWAEHVRQVHVHPAVVMLVLLAQTGSFIPAESGASASWTASSPAGLSDDIAGGRSTFMTEMETAAILNQATPRSLAVLGRDRAARTSTYDGLAIARSRRAHPIQPALLCKTLFATYYHEMTKLADVPRAATKCGRGSEEGGEAILRTRIVPGGADRSYGVCMLPGLLMQPVVSRPGSL